MFIKNKYTKWYFSIIESAKSRVYDCADCYEFHHIIPKSLGGNNEKKNIVKLTIREHFVCHILLVKMVESIEHKRSMAYAVFNMKRSNCGKRAKTISSREFDLARKIARKYVTGVNNGFYNKGNLMAGNKNPMYGKPCHYNMTEEEKQKWKNNISKGITGDKNPFYGKTHTEDTKQKISKSRSIPIEVKFDNGSSIEFDQFKNLGIYLGRSEFLGSKLCKKENSHLLKKYGIISIRRLKGTHNETNENQIDKIGGQL